MEKKASIFIIAILVLVVLIGGFFLFSGGFNSSSSSSSNNVQGIVAAEKNNSQDTGSASESSTPEIKEFNVIAKKWDFSPSTITVNEGDTVILNVESIDVTHGFVISEFGVSERLEPGKTTTVEFIADKKGTYTFFCNVYCGRGHSSMRGTLIVE